MIPSLIAMVPPSQRYNGRKNVVTAQGTIKKLTKAWKALGIEAKCSTNRGLQAGRFTLYLCQKKVQFASYQWNRLTQSLTGIDSVTHF